MFDPVPATRRAHDTGILLTCDMTTAGSDDTGRWEFRCWPDQPQGSTGILQAEWRQTSSETRTDIYLLPTRPSPRLVKLRHGDQLEIKELREISDRYQYWVQSLTSGFPLDSAEVAQLVASLGAETAPAVSAAGDARDLIASLAPIGVAGRVVDIVETKKSRTLFERGSCRAETTIVTVRGREMVTIAIEDSDRASAAAAIDDLGLNVYSNVDYGVALGAQRLSVGQVTA